jgi:predicted nucleic acid-binding protein
MAAKRLRGDVYDPREGEWTFDASTLISLRVAGLLPLVRKQFAGRAHIMAEVCEELDKGETGPEVRADAWFIEEELEAAEHLKEYRDLRLRWGSEAGRDQGEAASLVLCGAHRHGLVVDDSVGYSVARNEKGLCVMRMIDLVVAMVRAGWLTNQEAWDALRQMVDAGRTKFGVIPWGELDDRRAFDQHCRKDRGFDRCF